MAQQLGAVGAVDRVQADANRGRQAQRCAVQHDGRANRLAQQVGHGVGLARTLQGGQYGDEFVAAQARHQILGPNGGAQAPRHLAQQLVAGLVAQRIIDRLEMVEVDEQHGHLGVRALRLLHRGLQLLHQVVPVRQLRERVVQLQKRFTLLRCAARTDVAHDGNAVVLAMLGHALADDFHRHFMAVAVQQRRLVQEFIAPCDVGSRHLAVT